MMAVSPQAALAALEGALIEEFRALQAFLILVREERRALVEGDWLALETLLPRKEAAQVSLEGLEAARLSAARVWAAANGLENVSVILADLLPWVEAAPAQRLTSLREGILSLATEIRSLNRGNQSLATIALERAAAVRDFLMDLAQPTPNYQPFKAGSSQPGAVLAVEQWA